MSEKSMESVKKLDLTTYLAPVHRDVIEILGEEEVIRIEELGQAISGLSEFMKLPDPFKEHSDKNMLLITEETAKAMLEVQRADDIKDRASPEISLITRRQAPILEMLYP